MITKGNYMIWLPLWYPNRTEPFSGDFIQRHALAASAFMDIEVIVAIRDVSLPPGTREETRNTRGRLSETIVYYNVSDRLGQTIAGLNSYRRFNQIIDKCCASLIQSRGNPSAVHAHVFGKNAMAAGRWSRKLDIPLYYTEHATFFLKESPEYSFKPGSLSGLLFKKFMKSVSGSSFVSEYLASCVRDNASMRKYTIIPNVVDDSFFRPSKIESSKSPARFIHISTLGYQKNFEDIVYAFRELSRKNINFELIVFGPASVKTREMVHAAGLEGKVIFHGEQPHDIILPFLQTSDALILYSRYETFGCVVIEAASCGVPVIASDIPAMRELVREGENGIIVPGGDFLLLSRVLEEFITDPLRPDKKSLHDVTANRYGLSAIGKLFEKFYEG